MTWVPWACITPQVTVESSVNLVALQRIHQIKKMRGFRAFDNCRGIASFCRATSPCPLLFVTYFYVAPVAAERFAYTFVSTSLLYSNLTLSLSVVKTQSKSLCIIKLWVREGSKWKSQKARTVLARLLERRKSILSFAASFHSFGSSLPVIYKYRVSPGAT